jgi:hypothetical protein
MIPLRAAFHDDPPFRELLARMRQAVVEGIQHQDYPFPLLVEKLQPDRDFSRTPVFQTVFILQKFNQVVGLGELFGNTESDVRAEFGGLVLEPFQIPQQEGQFELSLDLAENRGVFQGAIHGAGACTPLCNATAGRIGLSGDKCVSAAIARDGGTYGVGNRLEPNGSRVCSRANRPGSDQGTGSPATGRQSGGF